MENGGAAIWLSYVQRVLCIVSIAGSKGDRMWSGGQILVVAISGLPVCRGCLPARSSVSTPVFFFCVPKGDQTFEQLLGFVGIEINCRTNVAEWWRVRWRVRS